MANLQNKHIVFVGGGNMASALVDGLLSADTGAHIGVIDKNQHKLDAYPATVKTALPSAGKTLLAQADVVVLAVKPQVMGEVCQSIRDHLPNKLIISIAAGLTLDTLGQMTGSSRLVRVMPNLTARVGFGASGLFALDITDTDKAAATAMVEASGIGVWVESEDDLHAVTAAAGSAPAYFFYMIEAMTDHAKQLGLDGDQAQRLIAQTMQGAALMAMNNDPAALRAQVTSKGGTTDCAIKAFAAKDLPRVVAHAMDACVVRSRELGV